jgi:cell wall-associated NlpC family hydrolase
MWAYEQLGVNLEHRASKQQFAGESTSDPKPGDIVVFTYKGSKSAYHVGIYLSPDKMIHAGGGKGQYTSIVSISKFAGNYSVVSYRRILQTI